ncbi:unnamed protein product [Cylindrotheca closterium]|uniref:Protein kinase domain-containing protein n=1 Tax=Cylindrotheca closterium TaxID=2856 RepID=A0AAD2FJY6_9STRA|nr:unnamed protein product [Cylindrotheca closterium]
MEPTNVFANTAPINEVNNVSEKCVSTSIDRFNSSAPSNSSHKHQQLSFSRKRLDLQWNELSDMKYLTHGGSSWVYSAVYNGKPVVVKTLNPKCREDPHAVIDIEAEVAIHSILNHNNIVKFVGSGRTCQENRFLVLERLTGGTLSDMLRLRNRRVGQFWKKNKHMPPFDTLKCARSLAVALQYMHEKAMPNCVLLHRDLKPENICFALDGTVKLLDFGLVRIVQNANSKSDEAYELSGETGSLRYMAPEVAEGHPYNHKVDVYSFGIILWEMNAGKRPFGGLRTREDFFKFVVQRGDRPPLDKRRPEELRLLISDCWNRYMDKRPDIQQVIKRLDALLAYAQEEKKSIDEKSGESL